LICVELGDVRQLGRYSQWANARLYGFALGLPEEACASVALMRKIVLAEPAGQDAGSTV
jgi:hypothetical protein